MNETLDISTAIALPLDLIPSTGDILLIGLVITLGVYGAILISKSIGFLLEGFAENYDFKSHMLLFIAMMVTYISVKMV